MLIKPECIGSLEVYLMEWLFSLKLVFLLIGTATLAIWLARWIFEKNDDPPSFLRTYMHRLLCGYALFSAFLLSGAVWRYAGLSNEGTSRSVPVNQRRGVEHLGYYLARDKPFTF